MRVAQILYEKAHWIFETDETMDELKSRFHPSIVFVDITDHPEVQEGWDYHADGSFSPSESALLLNPEEIRQQHLNALDEEYNPQFDALTLAWATASMEGDTETAAARVADKQTLKEEYQRKREAILSE
jgi:hypothetical protein